MRFGRRLSRNGHSNIVSLPAQLLNHLRWRGGDQLVIELTERDSLEIRRARPEDYQTMKISPMRLDPAPGAPR